MQITKDKFNSDFFGIEMGELIPGEGGSFSAGDLKEAVEKAKASGIQHLTLRVPGDDTEFLNIALAEGFSVSDVLTEWHVDYGTVFIDDYMNGHFTVREFREEDLETVKRIASSSIRCDRFHHDVNLPDSKCDEYYSVWAENLCHGLCDVVFVICDSDRVIGFAALNVGIDCRDRLMLVAIDSHERGQGAFGVLIRESIGRILRRWPEETGMDVGTYIDNITMQRGLTKQGFTLKNSKHVLYKMI